MTWNKNDNGVYTCVVNGETWRIIRHSEREWELIAGTFQRPYSSMSAAKSAAIALMMEAR